MLTSPTHRLIASCAFFACLFTSASAVAGERPSFASVDDAGDGPDDWVWVAGHLGADNVWIEGFYREPTRTGEVWIDAHTDAHGIHVPGHWVFEAPDDGDTYAWEPGYRDEGGAWVPGFWRVAFTEGFDWIPGYYDGETWVSGHWRPHDTRHAQTWEPGYVAQTRRVWRIGFWRPLHIDGFTWIEGYYADGRWYSGYWSPNAIRAGYIWVPGHAQALLWAIGFWRPAVRTGYSWVPGHWVGDVWVSGHWSTGHWTRPKHVVLGHYAHYHHRRGHGVRLKHRGVRKARYASRRAKSKPVVIVTPKKKSGHGAKSKPVVIVTPKKKHHKARRATEARSSRRAKHRRPLPATNPRYDAPPPLPRKQKASHRRPTRRSEARRRSSTPRAKTTKQPTRQVVVRPRSSSRPSAVRANRSAVTQPKVVVKPIHRRVRTSAQAKPRGPRPAKRVKRRDGKQSR